jgi:hypothetical protein
MQQYQGKDFSLSYPDNWKPFSSQNSPAVTFAPPLGIGGKSAVVTALYSDSIFQGQTEVDLLVTMAHPNGILSIAFVAPESERQYSNDAFEQMIQSMRFRF